MFVIFLSGCSVSFTQQPSPRNVPYYFLTTNFSDLPPASIDYRLSLERSVFFWDFRLLLCTVHTPVPPDDYSLLPLYFRPVGPALLSYGFIPKIETESYSKNTSPYNKPYTKFSQYYR